MSISIKIKYLPTDSPLTGVKTLYPNPFIEHLYDLMGYKNYP